MKKLLIFFAGIVIFGSCSKGDENKMTDPATAKPVIELPGKIVYTKNCKLCHGSDGTLGLSGAANLGISALNIEEKIQVITNGRKGMASYKGQLTADEIKQVAEYVETLKK